MTIDINKLRRLAQAATPGPWYATGKLTRYVEARIDGGLIQEVAACGPTKADGGYGPQQEANASLIAAANPATIFELLDRLERAEFKCLEQARLNGMGGEREAALMAKLEAAEKELAELRSSMKFRTSLIGRTEAERDALRAKIAKMEQQELARLVTPTAYRWRYRGAIKWLYGELTEEAARLAKEHNHEVQPLYALPGAQAHPASSEQDESVRKSWVRFSNELHRSPDAPYRNAISCSGRGLKSWKGISLRSEMRGRSAQNLAPAAHSSDGLFHRCRRSAT